MRRANAKPEKCIFVSHDEPEVKGAESSWNEGGF